MTRILIPTDFSDNAMHAAKYAVALFGAKGNSYTLLHAFFIDDYSGPMMPSYGKEMMKYSEAHLRDFSERFTQATGAEATKQHIAFGPLALVMEDHIKESKADIVVMGKRGKTGTALFGSNTTDVIKRSSVPVLVVPETAAIGPVKRILLAHDFEEAEPRNLGVLSQLARHSGAEVLITHVSLAVPASEPYWSSKIYDLALKDVRHSFLEARGADVINGLERTARHKHVDMIAVLHRHIGFLGRLLHPSTAKELALQSDRPLLVLEQEA
jgi:nucleotide-binding universal stress UspA family protein